MGSNFFGGGGAKSAVDPAGTAYSQMGSPGSQSTFGKAIMNDPVHNFLFGGKPQAIPATAGPWAGTGPSLSMANRGYATAGGSGMGATPQLGAGAPSAQLNATFGGGKW